MPAELAFNLIHVIYWLLARETTAQIILFYILYFSNFGALFELF